MRLRKYMKVVPMAMAATILAQAGEVRAEENYVSVTNESADIAVAGSRVSSDTGMKKVDGVWCYLVNGEIATSYTGLVKYNKTWVYVSKGKLDTTYTGLVKYNKSWVYVSKGKLDATYTGMVKYKNTWVYVNKGKLDTTYTGLAKNKYGWWHMTNGKLDLSYTGLSKNKYGWWHVSNGKLDTKYTGISTNKYGQWYVENGFLDTSYNGEVKLGGKIYTIELGRVLSEKKESEAQMNLGEYKGIKVDSSLAEISEEYVLSFVETELSLHKTRNEVMGVTFAEGDVAELDLVCYIDGKEYMTETDLEIEAGGFDYEIDGISESIIGKKTGDSYEITIEFDEYAFNEELAGKKATFKITLHSKIEYTIPEFTDEFVESNYGYLDLKTKEEFLAYAENYIRIQNIYSDVWTNVVVDTTEIISYDSVKLAEMTDKYIKYFEELIYSATQIPFDEYLEMIGQTREDFNMAMKEMAMSMLKEEMIVRAIAEAEGIVLTDEIYQKRVYMLAKLYGFDSVEEFEAECAMLLNTDDIRLTVLAYLVQEFICDNVELVDGFGVRD